MSAHIDKLEQLQRVLHTELLRDASHLQKRDLMSSQPRIKRASSSQASLDRMVGHDRIGDRQSGGLRPSPKSSPSHSGHALGVYLDAESYEAGAEHAKHARAVLEDVLALLLQERPSGSTLDVEMEERLRSLPAEHIKEELILRVRRASSTAGLSEVGNACSDTSFREESAPSTAPSTAPGSMPGSALGSNRAIRVQDAVVASEMAGTSAESAAAMAGATAAVASDVAPPIAPAIGSAPDIGAAPTVGSGALLVTERPAECPAPPRGLMSLGLPQGRVSDDGGDNAVGARPPEGPRIEGVDQSLHIPLDALTFQRRIGNGAAGTTYSARWRGGEVAVKIAGSGAEDLDAWRKEVRARSCTPTHSSAELQTRVALRCPDPGHELYTPLAYTPLAYTPLCSFSAAPPTPCARAGACPDQAAPRSHRLLRRSVSGAAPLWPRP